MKNTSTKVTPAPIKQGNDSTSFQVEKSTLIERVVLADSVQYFSPITLWVEKTNPSDPTTWVYVVGNSRRYDETSFLTLEEAYGDYMLECLCEFDGVLRNACDGDFEENHVAAGVEPPFGGAGDAMFDLFTNLVHRIFNGYYLGAFSIKNDADSSPDHGVADANSVLQEITDILARRWHRQSDVDDNGSDRTDVLAGNEAVLDEITSILARYWHRQGNN